MYVKVQADTDTRMQITINPKPELRGFLGDSLTKPPFGVTSAEVAKILPRYT